MNRHRVARGMLVCFAALCAIFAFALPARADTLDEIAKGLENNRLYVTTEAADALPGSARSAAEEALAGADTEIRVAVVQAGKLTTQQQADAFVRQIQRKVGSSGTYVVVATDRKLYAISNVMSGSTLATITSKAKQNSSDVGGLITQFVALSDEAVSGGSGRAGSGGAGASGDASSAGAAALVLLGIIVFFAVGGVGLVAWSYRRRKAKEARELAEVKQNAEEDVTRLGEDISGLDLDVMDPDLDPATRDDYRRALDAYDRSKGALTAAKKPYDMRLVAQALEEGRYFMACVRARLAGEPVPERRPPCFFNPQHGPSVRDIDWAPDGGTARPVPVCAADADRWLTGRDPETRMVLVNGERRPYWQAGPGYAPYHGGYYSGFGGADLFTGMLVGTMMGSMLSGGWGWGGGFADHGAGVGGDAGGGDGFSGAGDFSAGGDFSGGGDFGGGDFGGGDFGGFDF